MGGNRGHHVTDSALCWPAPPTPILLFSSAPCKLTWKPYFKEVLNWFSRNINWSWSLELNSEMGIASSSTSYGCSVSLSSNICITRKPAGNVNCLPLPRCAELETLRVELSNACFNKPTSWFWCSWSLRAAGRWGRWGKALNQDSRSLILNSCQWLTLPQSFPSGFLSFLGWRICSHPIMCEKLHQQCPFLSESMSMRRLWALSPPVCNLAPSVFRTTCSFSSLDDY